MKRYILYIIVLSFFIGCTNHNEKEKQKILVFCAASLTDVISEISTEFEKKYPINIQLNFASSGTLARQIEHGANPSLFISANKKWVSYLNDIGKTISGSEKEIAGNSLVAVAPVKSEIDSFSFEPGFDFTKIFKGRISIGDPKHVPAGEYAMQAIEKIGFTNEIEKRLLPAKDVRSALMVVELGATELGIVYKTDALKSEKVKIVAEIPSGLHLPIRYFASVLKNSNNEHTKLFYDFLNSGASKKIWLKNGFNIEM